MEELENLKVLVLHYIRGIWKNRWIAIAIAWPLMITGIIMVDQITDRYTAETKVYIDTTSVLKPLLKGLAIESDFQASVRLMVRKLLSRPNLERAARIMDMDIQVTTPEDMEKLITKIRSRVDISAKDRSGTYSISYSDQDRNTAKKMVQTLLDIFVEDTLGKSVNESDSAISFLDKQIEKYDQLLQEAENRREMFKRKNVGLMPKDGANYYSQLQQVNGELENAQRGLDEAVNRRNKVLSQLDKFNAQETVSAPATSIYDERILAQEAKLDDLLLLYTEEHPDVINARMVLESLKKRREEDIQEKSQHQEKVDKSNNPIYQELQILLTKTEADISSLKARVAAYQAKTIELKKLVDIVPKIEAELQRLNRDYDIHKKNYNELVQRREQAKISESVESGTEQVKFRIIEPPFVPTKADFPNRPLFDVAVLMLALGAGYGIGLVISLFQPVFYNINDLKKFVDLPILGAVRKFDTEEVLGKRRKNLFYFSLANLLFLCVAGVLILLHRNNILLLSSIKTMVLGV
jgi:polysaccharide chain length determinant protein (PEP-CTERM system associated)